MIVRRIIRRTPKKHGQRRSRFSKLIWAEAIAEFDQVNRRAGVNRRPVYFVALLAMLFAASCYSSNYRREMLASVSLVSELSDKLADYCRADFKVRDHVLSSEEMGEFYYGLQKARAFEAMTAKRQGSHESSAAFSKLVASYEAFVSDADRYRLDPSHTHVQLEQLLKDHELVGVQADEVKQALTKEL
jgi:hypothetical protein